MNDGDVEVESFVAVVAASVDVECAVLSSLVTNLATFVARSQKNYCNHYWKFWTMVLMMF